MGLLVAFSTNDGKDLLNEHAGMAKYFDVYEFSDDGVKFVERRKNKEVEEDETLTHGDPKKARSVSDVLKGVDVIVNRRFGPNIVRILKNFTCVVVKSYTVSDAIEVIKQNIDKVIEEHKKGECRKPVVL